MSRRHLVTVPEGGTPSKEQLDVALEVFDRRANAFGVGGVDLRATQDGRIILEMPGREKSDINRIKDKVRKRKMGEG